MLAAAVLVACVLVDRLSGAPQLTPPLLVAALVSWALCQWGIPRLRVLKLGQVMLIDPTRGGAVAGGHRSGRAGRLP